MPLIDSYSNGQLSWESLGSSLLSLFCMIQRVKTSPMQTTLYCPKMSNSIGHTHFSKCFMSFVNLERIVIYPIIIFAVDIRSFVNQAFQCIHITSLSCHMKGISLVETTTPMYKSFLSKLSVSFSLPMNFTSTHLPTMQLLSFSAL